MRSGFGRGVAPHDHRSKSGRGDDRSGQRDGGGVLCVPRECRTWFDSSLRGSCLKCERDNNACGVELSEISSEMEVGTWLPYFVRTSSVFGVASCMPWSTDAWGARVREEFPSLSSSPMSCARVRSTPVAQGLDEAHILRRELELIVSVVGLDELCSASPATTRFRRGCKVHTVSMVLY